MERSQHWTAFVPSAARWPVEVHLYPNRAAKEHAGLTSDEREDFAEAHLRVLGRIDNPYDMPMPYIAAWYHAPSDTPPQHSYLHLRFTSPRRVADKLKFLAGSEAAMGVFVNDVAPEQIPRIYDQPPEGQPQRCHQTAHADFVNPANRCDQAPKPVTLSLTALPDYSINALSSCRAAATRT